MLSKHASHLANQLKFMESNLATYEREIESLKRINDHVRYGQRLKEVEFKRTEVLEKISHVKPNMEKINEQIELLETK